MEADVGVIVCTYRRPTRLRRAVSQAFGEDLGGRQFVVIVDDASRDLATQSTIDELAAASPHRIVVVTHEKNQGPVAARNSGLYAALSAGARFVCFHDDDDWWLPERLSRGLAAIEMAPPAGAGQAMLSMGEQAQVTDRIHEDGSVEVLWRDRTLGYHQSLLRALLKGSVHIPFQTCLFRAELAREVGRFRKFESTGSVDEDLDFVLRALRLIQRRPDWSLAILPDLLAYHVLSEDSLSRRDITQTRRRFVQQRMLSDHLPAPLLTMSFWIAHEISRPALGRWRALSGVSRLSTWSSGLVR